VTKNNNHLHGRSPPKFKKHAGPLLGRLAVQQMESLSNSKEIGGEEKQKEPARSITRKFQFHNFFFQILKLQIV
jgi:hypothetical protein